MRFLLITLIVHAPDPVTGFQKKRWRSTGRVFNAQREFQRKLGLAPVFSDLEDFVERSSALIGSPQQVIDKVHRYHGQLGHTVLHLHAEAGGLTPGQHRDSLELFQSEIAPVLRRDIPDPPWPWGAVGIADPSPVPTASPGRWAWLAPADQPG